MELLKEVAPDTRRVAVIFNPQHFDDEVTFARRGAESLGIALTTHPIDNVGDLDAAQNAATAGGADSVFIISSRLTGLVAGRIAQYGQERRLPVYCFVARVCGQRCFVVLRAESGFRKLPAIDANRLARVVVTFTRGLAVMESAGYGRKQLKEAAATFVDALVGDA